MLHFKDWETGMPVPADIKWFYFIECGFNFHAIYATLFMDSIKKDFFIMILHHFVTIALIFVSYSTRYFKIGILVLFLHDVTDISLEFTKFNNHIKKRNGKTYIINEFISNIGFVVFAISWFVFRLYFFPLKVLYSSGKIFILKFQF
jgi:ceramide synthetase